MEKVVERLDDINKTLESMLAVMKQPENKVMTVFNWSRCKRSWRIECYRIN